MLITQLYTIRCTHRLARQAEFPYYNVQNNEIVQQTQAAIFSPFFSLFSSLFFKEKKSVHVSACLEEACCRPKLSRARSNYCTHGCTLKKKQDVLTRLPAGYAKAEKRWLTDTCDLK